jgi:hypothetical protein
MSSICSEVILYFYQCETEEQVGGGLDKSNPVYPKYQIFCKK